MSEGSVATQFIANVLVTSSTIMVVAVGFAIIYETVRFFHFAHGAVFTIGAYATFTFNSLAGVPLAIAFVLGMATSAIIGYGLEAGFYRSIRRKRGSPMVLLLASLGLYVVLQNAIGLTFGDGTKAIRGTEIGRGVEVFGARVTLAQLTILAVSAGLVVLVHLVLRRTRAGKAMRAVANDPQLAAISGIDTGWVLLCVFCIGSALAGAAGTLVALDVDMKPNMGLQPFMLAVVALIIGGRGSIVGIALGALLVGTAQQAGGWWLGAEWQDTVAFVVLLIFLVIRPHGFLGAQTANGEWLR